MSQTASKTLKIDFVSDVVCPWCVVGLGGLEAALEAAPSMKKSKMQENLIAHADMARLSRKLVALHDAMDLPEPLDDLTLKGIPKEPLQTFLEHHGFKTLLNRLGAPAAAVAVAAAAAAATDSAPPPPPMPEEEPAIDRSLYETVVTQEALDRWIDAARRETNVIAEYELISLQDLAIEL